MIMKKIFFPLLTILFSLLYTSAWGVNDFTIGNLGYRIESVENRSVYVSEALYDSKGVYVIPEEIQYNGVTFYVKGIDFMAFSRDGIKSVTIPSSINEIVACGFWSLLPSIETLIIEDSPEILDCSWMHGVNDYEGGQFSRTIVKDVYIGRNLAYVPYEEYYRDYSPFNGSSPTIETLEVGKYVTDLSYLNFQYYNSAKIKSITLHTTEPPKAPSFNNLQLVNVEVVVPRGSLEKYQSATTWSSFINLKESTENICKITLEYDKESGSIYTNGQLVDKEISLDSGSDLELILIPKTGKVIAGVYVNDENRLSDIVNNTLLISNITSDTSIRVVFSAPLRKVSMQNGESGAYCLKVEDGSSLEIAIEAGNGWKIKSLLVNNVDKTGEMVGDQLLLENITTDYTIAAVFEETSSSIKSLSSNNLEDVDIMIFDKTISFINAENASKTVFDASGKLIYSGTGNSYTVPNSGIYIITIKDKKYKVVL